MAQPAVITRGDPLSARLERYIRDLLDPSQADALRGNLSGARIRRLIARELGGVLLEAGPGYGQANGEAIK